jgi:hypothetical protein
MSEDLLERYIHGFLDKSALGSVEEVLKKPL